MAELQTRNMPNTQIDRQVEKKTYTRDTTSRNRQTDKECA